MIKEGSTPDNLQSMSQAQSQTLTTIQEWMMYPALMTTGIEVWDNMRKKPNPNEEENLESDYMDMRAMLIEDGFVGITAAATRHKRGKGGLLMGYSRLFRKDKYLSSRLRRKKIGLEIIAIPYVHAVQSAKLPSVPEEFRIDPEHEATQLWKGSRFQTHLVGEALFKGQKGSRSHFLQSLRDDSRAVVLLIEGSATLTLPVTGSVTAEAYLSQIKPVPHIPSVPVETVGIADQMSAIYNLAYDPRTRDNLFTYFIENNKNLAEDDESNVYRDNLVRTHIDLKQAFQGDTLPVVTLSNGTESLVSDLPIEQQRKLALILARSMATPAVIARDNAYMDYYTDLLFQQGVLKSPTDCALVDHLERALDMPVGRFGRIHNGWFSGPKTYDLDYLIKNEVVRRYPEFLDADTQMKA